MLIRLYEPQDWKRLTVVQDVTVMQRESCRGMIRYTSYRKKRERKESCSHTRIYTQSVDTRGKDPPLRMSE
jgi:hypothetical protein